MLFEERGSRRRIILPIQKSIELSDYPVCSSQDIRRDRETDLLRGLKIYNQLERCRLFDRPVRLLPSKNDGSE